MKNLCVIQHVEPEYLGLLEDHFEGRNIRFRYVRPFADGPGIPADTEGAAGLVLLGAGPYGVVSGALIPSLGPELRLTRGFLDRGLPVVGIGAGACILSVAAGGGAEEAPLRCEFGYARSTAQGALSGHLPQRFPIAVYMRDRPVPPADATVLAVDWSGAPAIFQCGGNSFGFLGHPGIKSAMIEDLVMAFDEQPAGIGETLIAVRDAQNEFVTALSDMWVGVVAAAGLMEPSR